MITLPVLVYSHGTPPSSMVLFPKHNIMIQALRGRRYKTLRTLQILNSVLVSGGFVYARVEKNGSALQHSLQRVQRNDSAR